MILDKETTFMNKATLSGSTNSDVISNGNGRDAYNPLWLYVLVNSTLSGPATVVLNTSDNENMMPATAVATYTVAAATGSTVAAKLPTGLKKYLRLTVTGASSGTMTAVLTLDVKI